MILFRIWDHNVGSYVAAPTVVSGPSLEHGSGYVKLPTIQGMDWGLHIRNPKNIVGI